MQLGESSDRKAESGFETSHESEEDVVGGADERLDGGGHLVHDGGRVGALEDLREVENVVLVDVDEVG